MVSKELVGTRLRQTRLGQRKTLKDVEAASGFSSTHISEIERGRTSPTVGALIRIANALDKDPGFFIEERELDEVCITSSENRPIGTPGLDLDGRGARLDGLTRGILGGRLLAFEINLEPGAEARIQRLPENGDLCLTCIDGGCSVLVGGEPVPFLAGCSLHVCVEEADLALRGAPDGSCRIVVFLDPKEAIF
jgi:transcriptional regulator with XRE-family HTH domain